MELTGQILEEDCGSESLSCAAHCLQLCVNEGLELRHIAKTIAAAKKLVGHFKHSTLATFKLHKRQEVMSIEPQLLQQAVQLGGIVLSTWLNVYTIIDGL